MNLGDRRHGGGPRAGGRIFKRGFGATLIASLALLFFAAAPGHTQNVLLDVLDPNRGSNQEASESSGPSGNDEMLIIENALAEARQRQAALERARDAKDEAALPSTALELAARLVRVLEQRREAKIQSQNLELGRVAIQTGLARDPSEIVGIPPPFRVPTLDGVLVSWRRAVDQESTHQNVLDDRRANLKLARAQAESLGKERRRLREALQREDEEVARIRGGAELRALEDRLQIAQQQAALAEQRVAIATLEHELKESFTRQATAALTWVESQIAPQDSDLSDAIERLDRSRLSLDRDLDLARSRLVSAEGTLRVTEERRSRIAKPNRDNFELELSSRRAQLSYRQQIVGLLSDRLERAGRMRTSWQHRYAVLGDRLDLEEAPSWRKRSDSELERLTRLRRIHETELAQARLDLANLLRAASEADSPGAARWIELEFKDLEELVSLYQNDLESLDTAIALEERLRVELLARMKDRDLGERVRGLWATTKSFWSFELTTSDDSPITPGKLLIALTVFVLGIWFARIMRELLSKRFFPRMGFDAGASSAFASLAFYGLLAAAFLFALRAVNIPLTAFAVAGGALAIGIGFGSQTIISNFISGLLLLAERPIRTGDLVEIGGVVGTVDSIGLRSTRIQTPDNFHIIVPNASFLESNVVNWTHEDPQLRLRVDVGVAYGSPVRQVEELLVQIAAEHPRALAHPPPAVVFLDFADSALLFQVRFWIRYDSQTDRSRLKSDIRFRIDEVFRESEIQIAFPQMDVHLDVAGSGSGAAAKSGPKASADSKN